MTVAAAPTAAEKPIARAGDEAQPRPSRREFFVWSVVTGGLFLGSGLMRVLNTALARPSDLTAKPPFPLADVPKSFDGWSYVEGSETHLDQPTTRITGSSDHVIRNYFDELTGTSLSALILYGPAEPVLPHTPQVCYPASGYRSVGEPVDRTVRIDDRLSAVFRSSIFVKSGGRSVLRQSVYHSYRLDGVWSPAIPDLSLPRRQAGLFKVQIQRRVWDGERVDGDEPIESFLRQLLPTLEKMIAKASHPESVSTVASQGPESSRPARP